MRLRVLKAIIVNYAYLIKLKLVKTILGKILLYICNVAQKRVTL